MQKRDILSLNLEELTEAVTALGQPKYRAGQIYRWLHVKKVSDFSEMLDLPAVLRAQLDVEFCLKRLFIARRLESCIYCC